ncbi:uncharacterized protein si:ch211-165i18.2 [Tachysurus fulvidraco]|uniref:uncharacterized protein si:ch211-165i18.2 n=1 Tax=Tachysurus fulvidraco TaxID=1234273 RepID=UPI001FF0129E|nr:uncharacterized protein si:ch211-165i18.2 [Tachysurus fulvidraco]
MFLLCLLTYCALSVQAKMVNNFYECSMYFYKRTEPIGMDQNGKKICQMLEYGDFNYATLYSVHHRIPLYSAYKFGLNQESSANAGKTTSQWHIEPQISNINEARMVRENESDKNIIKENQAISSDYEGTGYDRGHLNPNSFQYDDAHVATFTLTNAAPMDACFNRIYWKNCERNLRNFLTDQLRKDKDNADVYLVTGTVPHPNFKIPQTGNPSESQRVTVPSHIWTAVCYAHKFDNEKSFSFGYIVQNKPESSIILKSISDLNTELSELYSSSHMSIKIFVDDCFSGNFESENAVKMFQMKLLVKPEYPELIKEVQKNFHTVKRVIDRVSDSRPTKFNLIGLSATLSTDSLHSFSIMVEDLKYMESACLITRAPNNIVPASELRKGNVLKQSESIECQVVPEKSVAGYQTAVDGSHCQSVSDSSSGCICTTEGKSKSCCSTPCLYRQDRKDYWCYSGQTLIKCLPQYSLITYKGERCKDNYPCATYGYDYYWCSKVSGSWDYCSPPLWKSKASDGKYCRNNHACAKYGKSNPYCYTDDNDKKECCISDDCFSAVNDKKCKSNHPCGYYGNSYLWCYTTDGNWDYCCTFCGQ